MADKTKKDAKPSRPKLTDIARLSGRVDRDGVPTS